MKKKVALVLNILLIIFEILGFYIAFKTGEEISPKYYTEDSNLICLIGSLIFVIFYIRGKESNKTVNFFRFLTTLNLLVTFVITLFLLAPDLGYDEMMLNREFIFFHTLCPITSFVSYIFFEKYRFTKNNKFIIQMPAISMIYGLIAYALNFMKMLDGPYEFFRVYEHSATYIAMNFIGMAVGIFLFTFVLIEVKKKIKI